MPDRSQFHVYTSPQLAPLLEHLVADFRRAPLPPRDQEVVVVQSQGMRRWLTLQMADAFGCVGSVSMPFPAHFVRDIGRQIAPGTDLLNKEGDPFSREALAWRIDAFLQRLPRGDIFKPLRTYLAGNDDRKRFGLAGQIAARLDDYQMYRADLLKAWESGGDTPDTLHAKWQASLWRTLCKEIGSGTPHLGEQLRQTIDTLGRATAPNLPARITVFGVSTLPALFIELLSALAHHIPVHVYSATLNTATQHTIAASFGAQGREFISILTAHGAHVVPVVATSPGHDSLLSALQTELAEGHQGDTSLVLNESDASLRIHNAHGEMRQLEVIRDQLLAALNDDDTLRPHDVLLLVPDAGEWAPYVDAVFGAVDGNTVHVPYHIADRPLRRTQPVAEAFATLLSLEGSRLARSEVFGLLAHPMVRQGANLTESDVEALEALTLRANIRWGYNAQSRATLGLPEYEEASWRTGLDRLLLGVAMGPIDEMALGVLPEGGDTAGDPETLAKFAAWVDLLADTLAEWRIARTIEEWSATLVLAIDAFFRADGAPERQQLAALANTIQQLGTLGAQANYTVLTPFGVVRDWLDGELSAEGLGSRFLRGGMTVAALKPMRSIPMRVIAVAGLDDGVFPRRERRPAFDLLDHERRVGDRDLRTDDRQLFLDLLLATQDRLILAYSGRAVSDNSTRAPSVVIDELLDHLDRRTGRTSREQLVVTHPLQPFSDRYFRQPRDARLFTFSASHARAARANAERADIETRFVTAQLATVSAPAPVVADLMLRDLVDCFTNPSRFYCQRTLRIFLGNELPDTADEELFSPGSMEQGGVKARMLANALRGSQDPEYEAPRLIARGKLPVGELGAAWYERLNNETAAVLATVPDAIGGQTVPIALAGNGWHLRGRIDGVGTSCRFVVRAGGIRPEHRIRAWIEHVVMCAARENGDDALPNVTQLIGKKGLDECIGPVDNATQLLDLLVGVVQRGQALPLSFFAQTAWEWFSQTRPKSKKGKGSRTAPRNPLESAMAEYSSEQGDFGGMPSDCEDDYVMLCFRGREPDWKEFEQLAGLVFGKWQSMEITT